MPSSDPNTTNHESTPAQTWVPLRLTAEQVAQDPSPASEAALDEAQLAQQSHNQTVLDKIFENLASGSTSTFLAHIEQVEEIVYSGTADQRTLNSVRVVERLIRAEETAISQIGAVEQLLRANEATIRANETTLQRVEAKFNMQTLSGLAKMVDPKIDATPDSDLTFEDLELFQVLATKMRKKLFAAKFASAGVPEDDDAEAANVQLQHERLQHDLKLAMPCSLQDGQKSSRSTSDIATLLRGGQISTRSTPSMTKLLTKLLSNQAKEASFQEAVAAIEPKIKEAPETVTKEEANLLHKLEVRAFGLTERGGVTARAMSLARKNEAAAKMGAAGSSNNASDDEHEEHVTMKC
ncbi:uncharacterized protein BDZ99DRAFT_574188 [Mytilinidion resinicola]|uniref:Uncharacterized protein n=1 Tax=Mytilinidion resinicola TaxID=574789 RepID=A0A6A6YD48_9PEZI|nr:uncharacterized protein BDZ99DRAFT_574188 [Mytilinidion resinicola]KAF2805944.1 hypothetical protein BDZ99DRAFT_574188 [Mytilinidion resinicola]